MKEELHKSIQIIKEGGTLLYPTDTVWGLGCDARNEEAVQKIYALKQREESKALICLVSDVIMLERIFREIPDAAYDLIDHSDKPTTIIYDNPNGVAKNLIAPDNTLAVRVVKDEFCQQLIRKLNRPIVSTSANISGAPTPKSFKEISNEILSGVDYVVNLHREKICEQPSTIIKLSGSGLFKIIRK
ncbi:L-threonylcarbamoyladenylate synthase [Pustulibacterium marinum]|uniref:L-threonylcarbamoyladenylate synthase n=1 Tax=Pustulibacterium marinum TaxID=1224947 RepID=A0A1I7HVH0_9FLAO|nr:L-threonylcarbamoyladenylate synthase [Pustulibacterium marinum]SFU64728.1 L-threonylcarbamoyladenylate synthase [Pustulibacterium marinum]